MTLSSVRLGFHFCVNGVIWKDRKASFSKVLMMISIKSQCRMPLTVILGVTNSDEYLTFSFGKWISTLNLRHPYFAWKGLSVLRSLSIYFASRTCENPARSLQLNAGLLERSRVRRSASAADFSPLPEYCQAMKAPWMEFEKGVKISLMDCGTDGMPSCPCAAATSKMEGSESIGASVRVLSASGGIWVGLLA